MESYSSSLSSTATGPSISSTNTSLSKLDLASTADDARKGGLPDSLFSSWDNDAKGAHHESPEELQKKDPLGIQIWKLYSKTKTQLPNQERMDNLSWRMMSMKLKKQQTDQDARFVQSHVTQGATLTSHKSKTRRVQEGTYFRTFRHCATAQELRSARPPCRPEF